MMTFFGKNRGTVTSDLKLQGRYVEEIEIFSTWSNMIQELSGCLEFKTYHPDGSNTTSTCVMFEGILHCQKQTCGQQLFVLGGPVWTPNRNMKWNMNISWCQISRRNKTKMHETGTTKCSEGFLLVRTEGERWMELSLGTMHWSCGFFSSSTVASWDPENWESSRVVAFWLGIFFVRTFWGFCDWV